MENQSDPRTKKLKKFLIACSDEQLQNYLKTVINRSTADVILGSSAPHFDLFVEHEKDERYKLSGPEISPKTLTIGRPNLTSYLNLVLSSYYKTSRGEQFSSGRLPTSNISKLESQLSKQVRKTPGFKTAHLALKDAKVLDDFFDESLSISSFISTIFSLSLFSTYRSCYILIHEKGKSDAESFHSMSRGEVLKSNIPVQNFNTIFQSIKKSKSKIFNSSTPVFSNLPILGPFLAKEFEYLDFNCLLVLSREEFLPLSKEEHDFFDSITRPIKIALYGVITRARLSDREKALMTMLNNYPLPLSISVGDNIIFKNKKYNSIPIDKLNEPTILPLGYDRICSYWSLNAEETLSDIYHHQRLSLLGELLNTLKHELSNPLFGLRLISDLLSSEINDEESKAILLDIQKSCTRCDEIISNFSKLYVDTSDVENVDLSYLINEVFTLAKSETREIEKRFEPADNVPIMIKTHPTWLTQILFNLVVNSAQAIKSRPNNRGVIQITAENNAKQVIIQVSDNGPGIPDHLISHIFKPYFTSKNYGTGLGLSICKRLCERLNGSLSFRNNGSSPGATFSVLLRKD